MRNLIPFALILVFASCINDIKNTQVITTENESEITSDIFIKSPLPQANVPFSKYTIDAEKGDTLFHQSGSIIVFPAHSVVDKNGNLVKGMVDINYREFIDPIDFYLAGVPLDYDSLGTTYSFESSGMCEVTAYKDGEPVFVNPSSLPEINMVSTNSSKTHSIYFLDTVKKNWINRKMSTVTDLSKTVEASIIDLPQPIRPEKANDKSPVIEIEIEPGSFKELLVYDNLKFQLDVTETGFDAKDADIIWNDIQLTKKDNLGLYTLKFINGNKSVSYSAKPVFEGEDYKKALLVFDQKNAEYKKEKENRQMKEVELEEEIERRAKINALIEARNKAILEENQRQEVLYEQRKKEYEQLVIASKEKAAKALKDRNQSAEIIRNFSIDGFGIWNCDKAFSLDSYTVIAKFIDKEGNALNLSNLAVVQKSFNGIQKFYNNEIRIVKGSESMIFAINDGRLAYLKYSDFNNLDITEDDYEYTFTMRTVPSSKNNYSFLKDIGEK
nr:hypothetical protein [uncultured Brumimicrobium sp.]